ncbi:uncharacterized protein O3C94_016970 [Discoglossus pictus]
MKTLITSLLIVLLACQMGHTLDCYTCEYGICLIPIKTSCGLLEVCVTETSGSEYINLKRKGCISPFYCLKESSQSYAGITVTTTATCCITNLCNSAASSKMSLVTCLSALAAILLAKMS